MRVISPKMLREFWSKAAYRDSELPLRAWSQNVKTCDWTCFADVRRTFNSADAVGNKVVFNIGGNKYRIIAFIDYERHKVFIRSVLDHKDYDKGRWKDDPFGKDWKPPSGRASGEPTTIKKGKESDRVQSTMRQKHTKKK